MQGAGWTCDIVTLKGNQFNEDGELLPPEKLELWRRDPVECVMELLGNPAFKNHIKCAPEQKYKDAEGKIWVFDEMWTADWWWDTQVSLMWAGNILGAYQGVRKNCQLIQQLLPWSFHLIKPNWHSSEGIRAHGRFTSYSGTSQSPSVMRSGRMQQS